MAGKGVRIIRRTQRPANIGSNDVAGHSAFWGTVGFHWNITKNVSWSAGWGFPLQSRSNNDLFDQRATAQIHITF